jgi:hypothetical protein
MSQLDEILPKTLSFGEPMIVHGLGVIPVFNFSAPDIAEMVTLDHALGAGHMRVTETSEAGEVPFLLVENNGNHPVIILDGEELWGGKQNRIVNTTIIVLAHTTIKIPVSCVQKGRWQQQRSDFESPKSILRARSRGKKTATVSMSLREGRGYRSDQGAVWLEVEQTLTELHVASPTGNYREGMEHVAHKIDDFVAAIRPMENQIGALFLSKQQILGLEILATPMLYAASSEKIVKSFAFEVLGAPDLKDVDTARAIDWWGKVVKVDFSSHESVGAGEDVRINTEDGVGCGLLWNDALVHLCCFPNIRQEELRPSTRRTTATQRRRNLRSNFDD